MSEISTGQTPSTSAPAPKAAPAAAPAPSSPAPRATQAPAAKQATQASGGNKEIPKNAKLVGEREAIPQKHKDDSVYNGKRQPITMDSWKEKLAELQAKDKAKKSGKPAPKPAKKVEEPIVEAEPAAHEEEILEPAQEHEEIVESEGNEEGEEGSSDEPLTPAQGFKLNPKFSALSKEYELPKTIQDMITSPEQEKEIKDVYSKAMGLDHVKMRHQETIDAHKALTGEYNELAGAVEEARSIYAEAQQSGNLHLLDDFFQILKVPQEVLLQYVAKKVQLMELPPDQQQIVMSQQQAWRNARTLSKQNQNLQQQSFQASVQSRTMHVDNLLARPDVAAVANVFDSAPGRKPGSFKEAVWEHGKNVWMSSQGRIELSPEEAIVQTIQKYGVAQPAAGSSLPIQGLPQNANPAQPQAGQPAPTPAPQRHKVPVIPTVMGRGGSPTKQKPGSIADLRKLAKDMKKR